ncbi:MAG: FHA domain-containing protein [Phormidesmis sp.]
MSASNNVITLSLLHPVNKAPIQSWTFTEERVVRIGRSLRNDVVLYSAVVSRYHAELRRGETGWEVHNTGANGTYLAGQRIDHQPVEDGLIIRLARSGPNIQINFSESEGMSAAQAPPAQQQQAVQ